MSSTYHYSPKTRQYSVCTAELGGCPYGGNHISEGAYKALRSGAAYDRDSQAGEMVQLEADAGAPDVTKVAPEGVRGMYCICCRHYYTDEFCDKLEAASAKDKVRCPNCDEVVMYDLSGVDIRSSEAKYLKPEAVRSSSWFHVTTNPDWLEDMKDKGETYADTPMVHVGSKEAALDRLRDLRKWQNDGAAWYLYELKINPEATLHDKVFEDENDTAPSNVRDAKHSKYSADGVTRYVNRYEGPGTISLIANPNALHEVKSVEVPL